MATAHSRGDQRIGPLGRPPGPSSHWGSGAVPLPNCAALPPLCGGQLEHGPAAGRQYALSGSVNTSQAGRLGRVTRARWSREQTRAGRQGQCDAYRTSRSNRFQDRRAGRVQGVTASLRRIAFPERAAQRATTLPPLRLLSALRRRQRSPPAPTTLPESQPSPRRGGDRP